MSDPVDTLAAQPTLDHETMWRYMRRLLERLFGVLESEAVMDDCLDILVDLIGADRGLILLTDSTGRRGRSMHAGTESLSRRRSARRSARR